MIFIIRNAIITINNIIINIMNADNNNVTLSLIVPDLSLILWDNEWSYSWIVVCTSRRRCARLLGTTRHQFPLLQQPDVIGHNGKDVKSLWCHTASIECYTTLVDNADIVLGYKAKKREGINGKMRMKPRKNERKSSSRRMLDARYRHMSLKSPINHQHRHTLTTTSMRNSSKTVVQQRIHSTPSLKKHHFAGIHTPTIVNSTTEAAGMGTEILNYNTIQILSSIQNNVGRMHLSFFFHISYPIQFLLARYNSVFLHCRVRAPPYCSLMVITSLSISTFAEFVDNIVSYLYVCGISPFCRSLVSSTLSSLCSSTHIAWLTAFTVGFSRFMPLWLGYLHFPCPCV